MKNNKEKSTKNTEMANFIKANIYKKTRVLILIGILLLTFIITVMYTSDGEALKEFFTEDKISLLTDIKNKLVILVLILVAGWVPYFYLSAIAYMAYIFILSGNIIAGMIQNKAILTLLLNIIPGVIDIFTASVITALGLYMCNCMSKRYRYMQSSSFSFLDVKLHFYEMVKNEEKQKKILEKKQKKIENGEKNNVKLDYKSMLKIAPIMIAINLLITIVQHYIN